MHLDTFEIISRGAPSYLNIHSGKNYAGLVISDDAAFLENLNADGGTVRQSMAFDALDLLAILEERGVESIAAVSIHTQGSDGPLLTGYLDAVAVNPGLLASSISFGFLAPMGDEQVGQIRERFAALGYDLHPQSMPGAFIARPHRPSHQTTHLRGELATA
jgi:hypothetical protein